MCVHRTIPSSSSSRFPKLMQNRLEGAWTTSWQHSLSRASSAWRATRETRLSSSSAAMRKIIAIGIWDPSYTLARQKVQSKQTWKLRKLWRWHGLLLQFSSLILFFLFFSSFFLWLYLYICLHIIWMHCRHSFFILSFFRNLQCSFLLSCSLPIHITITQGSCWKNYTHVSNELTI